MNVPLLLDLVFTVTLIAGVVFAMVQVRDFILITWRKTRAHMEAVGREQARDTFAEWVEWLHARIAEREKTLPPVPSPGLRWRRV